MSALPTTARVVVDGYLVDAETGEIVGVVPPKPGFSVDSAEAAEWVLQKLTDCDVEIASLKAREQAILANLAAMKRTQEQRKASLLFRFEGELVEFAKSNLPHGKKTFTTPYGSVGFKAHGLSVSVDKAQSEKALEWGKEHCPECLKTTAEVQVSKIPVELKDEIAKAGIEGFTVKLPGESVTIKTGVDQ